MKIYCNCNFCNSKIYFASSAQTRQQLVNSWGLYFSANCNSCQSQNQFNVNLVKAEPSHSKTPFVTTVGGGLIGIIAGPIGVLIGLAAGGIVGRVASSKDEEAVNRFNSNHL